MVAMVVLSFLHSVHTVRTVLYCPAHTVGAEIAMTIPVNFSAVRSALWMFPRLVGSHVRRGLPGLQACCVEVAVGGP